MRKQGTGKISQNININSKFITPINVDTPVQGNVDMGYFASSLTTFIDAGGDIFFPVNLSNIDTIFTYSQVQPAGNTIFTNVQTTPTVVLKYKGEESETDMTIKINSVNEMSYVDNGRDYVVSGVKNESHNFENEPANSTVINNNINIKSKLFGIPDVFIEHQSREEMIEESGLKASKIIKKIEELRLVK